MGSGTQCRKKARQRVSHEGHSPPTSRLLMANNDLEGRRGGGRLVSTQPAGIPARGGPGPFQTASPAV